MNFLPPSLVEKENIMGSVVLVILYSDPGIKVLLN